MSIEERESEQGFLLVIVMRTRLPRVLLVPMYVYLHPCIFSTFPAGGGGGKYLHFWGFGAEYWYLLLHFPLFLRVFELFFEVFLQYKPQRAQKCNKNSSFPLFRGSGDQNKIFIKKKKWGRTSYAELGHTRVPSKSSFQVWLCKRQVISSVEF